MLKKLVFCIVFGILLVSPMIFAGNFVAFQGNVNEGSTALTSGNLSVAIFDSESGGSVVYNSTTDFDGAISNGKYDVMLGNGSNVLNLNYGQKYYLEMFVNGEVFTFNGNSRQVFESAVGNVSYIYIEANIPSSYINKSGGTNWVGQNVESILDTLHSWFTGAETNLSNTLFVNSTSGNVGIGTASPEETLYVQGDINATGDICITGGNCLSNVTGGSAGGANGTYNVTYDTWAYNQTEAANESISNWVSSAFAALVGGNAINGTQTFNGGWTQGGVTISAGKIFAQTLYVYNLSSLAVNQLDVNGSMIPAEGFDNTFDLGSSLLRWRNLYLGQTLVVNNSDFVVNATTGNVGVGTASPTEKLNVVGNVNVTGNLTLGAGQIMFNDTDAKYYYYNKTAWVVIGSGSGSTTTSTAAFKQYYGNGTSNGGDFNVTGTDWTTTRAVAVPYKTTDGSWRMKFNIRGTLSGATNNILLTISGITFKNITNFEQAIAVGSGSGDFNLGKVNPDASTIFLQSNSVATSWWTSGDVELESQPTWADDVNGSNLWSQSGSNIYYNSGNVGVGTASPTEKLNVVGNVNVTQNLSVGGAIIYKDGGNLVFRI